MSHNTIKYNASLIGLRTDGSSTDGIGHLQRQLILARTLKDRFAWEPIFLSTTEKILRKLFDQPDEFKIKSLSDNDFTGFQEGEICRKLGIELLICDLKQPVEEKYIKTIQDAGTRIWLYGNTGSGRQIADCNVFAFPGVAMKLVDDYADLRLIDSHDNSMMSPLFTKLRQLQVFRRSEPPIRIFLSMGGADHAFLTAQVIDALALLDHHIHLNCVIGPGFPHGKELEKKLKEVSYSWVIHQEPEYFPYLAAVCDLAVTQMGNTVAELNCLGVPVLLLNSSAFHNKVADLYCHDGSAFNLGLATNTTVTDLKKKLEKWLDDVAGRERLSLAGLDKIDGRGATRVAAALFQNLQCDFVLVRCDVCTSDDFNPLHILNGRPIVQCNNCGLHYMNIRPSPELLQNVYASEYFTAPRTQGTVSSYEADKPNVLRFAQARLAVLERLLPDKGRLT